MIEKHFQSNKIISFKNFEYLINEYAKIYKGLKPEDDWVFNEDCTIGWNEKAYTVTFKNYLNNEQ
jgi:hypothetical protein